MLKLKKKKHEPKILFFNVSLLHIGKKIKIGMKTKRKVYRIEKGVNIDIEQKVMNIE